MGKARTEPTMARVARKYFILTVAVGLATIAIDSQVKEAGDFLGRRKEELEIYSWRCFRNAEQTHPLRCDEK